MFSWLKKIMGAMGQQQTPQQTQGDCAILGNMG
jgi:hypothetical protein